MSAWTRVSSIRSVIALPAGGGTALPTRSRHALDELPSSFSGFPFQVVGRPCKAASSRVVRGRCQVPSSAMITGTCGGGFRGSLMTMTGGASGRRGSATAKAPLSIFPWPVTVFAASDQGMTPYAWERSRGVQLRGMRGSATE